jgi:PAS domain S-box-containing protein
MKITRRLLIPILIFLSLAFLSLLFILTWQGSKQFEQVEEENLRKIGNIFISHVQGEEELAIALALQSANNPEIQAALAAQNRDALLTLTLPGFEQLFAEFGIPLYQFHLPPATVFLRLQDPDNFGDDLSGIRQTIVQANANQEIVSGLEMEGDGTEVRGIAPVTYQGQHIGAVEFGIPIDETFLNALKQEINADLQISLERERADLTGKESVTTSTGPTPELFLYGSTLATPLFGSVETYSQVLDGQSVYTRRVTRGEENYGLLSIPLRDFSGEIIGVVDILVDRTSLVQSQVTNAIFLVVLVVIYLVLISYGMSRIAGRTLHPINELTEIAEAIADGDRTRLVQIDSPDELGNLADSFNKLTNQQRSLVSTLEERLTDLVISGEVSRSLSTILDPNHLVQQVVDQVRGAFNFYHVQIYLLDEDRQQLVMAGGTGEAGQAMMDSGHRLPIGRGLVGQVAASKTSILVSDVSQDRQWLPNPLLPETKSEITVPILLGEQVLGVLDVQHNVTNGVNEATANLLQTIASQIAIALQNADQYKNLQDSQQAIRERETLLRTIIDATPDWIFVKDSDHRYVLVNQGYANSLNLPVDSFIGKNDLDIGFPEEIVKGDPERGIRGFWADDQEIMTRGELKVIDIEPAVVDGEPRYLNTIKAPLKNAVGEVVGVVGFVHDITKQVQVEETTRANETLLRTIIDSTPDWIFVKDTQHRYRLVNQGYANSLNLPVDSFIGKNDLDIGFPEEIVKGDPERGIRGFWADDQEIMTRGELKVIDIEPATIDGEARYLNTIKAPLKNAVGEVVGVVGFVHDITKQVQVEETTRANETLLRTIIDSTPDWIFVKDTQHRYRLVNQGYANSLNLPVEGFIGKNDLEIGFPAEIVQGDPEKGIRGFWADDREIMDGGQTKVIPEEPAVVNGQPRVLNTIKLPLHDATGQVTGLVGFVHDITNLKQAERTLALRAYELQTVAQVGMTTATILEPAQLTARGRRPDQKPVRACTMPTSTCSMRHSEDTGIDAAYRRGRDWSPDGRPRAANQPLSGTIAGCPRSAYPAGCRGQRCPDRTGLFAQSIAAGNPRRIGRAPHCRFAGIGRVRRTISDSGSFYRRRSEYFHHAGFAGGRGFAKCPSLQRSAARPGRVAAYSARAGPRRLAGVFAGKGTAVTRLLL